MNEEIIKITVSRNDAPTAVSNGLLITIKNHNEHEVKVNVEKIGGPMTNIPTLTLNSPYNFSIDGINYRIILLNIHYDEPRYYEFSITSL